MMTNSFDKMAAELLVANKELLNNEAELAAVKKELKIANEACTTCEKRINAHLQESIAMLDKHSDIIARFDKDFRYLYINRPVLMGRNETDEGWIGKSIHDRGLPVQTTNEYLRAHKFVFETGMEITIEISVPIMGAIHYFETRMIPEFGADGVTASVIAISRDITVQKNLEKKLFKQSQVSKAMLDNNPDVIARLDKNRRYIYINHVLVNGNNETKDDVVGKTIRDRWFPEEYANELEKAHNYVFTTGKETTFEESVMNNGKMYWFENRYSPEFAEDGTVESCLCIVRNITERKKIEQEMEAHTAKLTIANKELEQFSFLSSHDLREPLLTIRNFTELILAEHGQDFTDVSKRYFQVISQSAMRMEDLLRGLLDFSRISNPKQLNDEVDCNEIVKETIADLDSLISKNKAIITVEPLPILKAYPLELKILFENLITNAIKYKKKDTVPEISISVNRINKGWQFAITDNGIGIEKTYYEKIFLIFQRLHKRSEYEGTGIGLAYCKKIAELHGGRIWVESIPGQSSTFYFTILTELQ